MKRVVVGAAGIVLAGAIGVGVAAAATGSGPGTWVSDALSGLVDDGTITQKQADAVAEALEDSRQTARDERVKEHQATRDRLDAVLQDTLGMTTQEVMDQLRAGKTLKEIAGDNADELAAAAATVVKERAAAAVTARRITQGQAARLVAAGQERIDAWLAGDEDYGRMGLGLLLGGRGLHGLGEHGFGGQGRGGSGLATDTSPTPSAGSGEPSI